MRSLTGDKVGEPLLNLLWLGRLPNGTQTILAALNENLDQLATVSDKINDLFLPVNNFSCSNILSKTAQIEQQISQLTQEASELTSFVKRFRSPTRNSNHICNRSNSRNRFERYQGSTNGYCCYHTNLATSRKSVPLHSLFVRKTRMTIVTWPHWLFGY
ncbi:uncharacterized protein TNCT_528181 [Trichonephila clavata]|uniref:Uncharacterized protein n=1 Tax=Trichonephila clavata TaxID=2740835 RepID=A0A8X6GMI0_TRICU|nr:uncharacterized protein TNCT_528181 [Trichonephila clavata]